MEVQQDTVFQFGPFRFDAANQQLWRDGDLIQVRPKPLAVLEYLLTHAGRLVTRTELLQQVWPDTVVSPTTLHVCVRELRKALDDQPHHPQFIETAGQQGYRFIAAVNSSASLVVSLPHPHSPTLVGREAELAQLRIWLAEAQTGARQVVFVAGELGVGKTALVDQFVSQVSSTETVWVGYGQCVEQYGQGEAYLPVLAALSQLSQEQKDSGDGGFVDLLRQYAPSWLLQLPALLSETDVKRLPARVQAASRERMLREFADFIEAFTNQTPLILVFEDLHWSDVSTLELIAHVAQRRQPARLLIIGTYRPTEVVIGEHPLRNISQELLGRSQCHQLRVELLSDAAVKDYVTRHVPSGSFASQLAALIHRRTDGNALFMVNLLEHCLQHLGWRAHSDQTQDQLDAQMQEQERIALQALEHGLPDQLRHVIEKQFEKLQPDEQAILERASIAGSDFAAPAVAADGVYTPAVVETTCDQLASSGRFLQSNGFEHWPDGTLAVRYRFIHVLYQEVIATRVTRSRQIRLHQKIGQRKELGYGPQTSQIAAELAARFEHGRDMPRVVQYRRQAGETALRRSAHREAVEHFTKGIAALTTLPHSFERDQQGLFLHLSLGMALSMTQGYAHSDAARAYEQAYTLSQQLPATPHLFPALYGLIGVFLLRGDLKATHRLGEQSLQLAQQTQDTPDAMMLLQALFAQGSIFLWQGKFVEARSSLEQSLALYERVPTASLTFRPGEHPKVSSLCQLSPALWALGYPDQARAQSQEALTLSQDTSFPLSLAQALIFAAMLSQLCGHTQLTQKQAQTAVEHATEQAFPFWVALGEMLEGWARAQYGQVKSGIARLRQGLSSYNATGAGLVRTYYLSLLAGLYRVANQPEDGLQVIAEALADMEHRDERFYEAELYRLRGELILNAERRTRNDERQKKTTIHHSSFIVHHFEEAEACFEQAITIAQRQKAKSLELRAVMSLTRLWQSQGKKEQARQQLAEIYNWFSEGFDTLDLQQAKALLDELS